MNTERTATPNETDRLFQEIVLCLGGIFAARHCDDALIWQVTRSLARIYARFRPRRAEPHAAVESLLSQIGR